MTDSSERAPSLAFLLSQVGAHASAGFAARLEPLGLHPCDAGLLVAVRHSEGLSQQELAARLGANPSRLVALVDRLEAGGLLERRTHAGDRRVHALYLAPGGNAALSGIERAVAAHEKAILGGLSPVDRSTLVRLLRKLADVQGLTPGVHPGFAAALAGDPSGAKKAAPRPPRPAARTRARRSRRD